MSLANFLRKNLRGRGQATIEYLVLFSVMTLATVLGISTLLVKARESGKEALERSIGKMSDICSGEGCAPTVPQTPEPPPED